MILLRPMKSSKEMWNNATTNEKIEYYCFMFVSLMIGLFDFSIGIIMIILYGRIWVFWIFLLCVIHYLFCSIPWIIFEDQLVNELKKRVEITK